jgi:hypothetical protein
MRHVSSSRWWTLGLTLSLAALLAGCGGTGGGGSSSGAGTGAGSATATATTAGATATPVTAPPHAFAWFQYDAHHVPQIWASVNGAAPTQITHVAPDGHECTDQVAWSPPVFSPDLTHIVASMGSFNCGDGDMQGPVSVITVSSASVTTLSGSYQARTTQRSMGWLDNSTIWFVTYNGVYTQALGGGAPSHMSGPTNIWDAVVRGSTLYWQAAAYDSTGWTFSIHRYDLSSHTALPGSIAQGKVGKCQCSPGDMHGPGWDVTRDGSHIVYQTVTPNLTADGGVASSKLYYANADGSGATQIAHAMIAKSTTVMQFSPNGQWVAITEAAPSPTTLTASVTSPGGSGDPSFHAYSTDTFNYPVWKWDNSQFWAAAVGAADGMGGASTSPRLERFNRGGSGAVGVANGFNPWYTIGG